MVVRHGGATIRLKEHVLSSHTEVAVVTETTSQVKNTVNIIAHLLLVSSFSFHILYF